MLTCSISIVNVWCWEFAQGTHFFDFLSRFFTRGRVAAGVLLAILDDIPPAGGECALLLEQPDTL